MTDKKTAVAEPEIAQEPAGFALNLDEFCLRLSKQVKRPELIGGFYSYARKLGLLLAEESDFMRAFEAFRRTPA